MSDPTQSFTTVRIKKSNLKAIAALAKELGIAAANVVDLCLEDCLDALEKKRPITPRVVKLRRVMRRQQKKKEK